ncbi:MAG TPA: tRNA epoxyqueuosine(34) reductase QueG [Planctomycetota bacterium]|nr:tRNA epoxyqueuosine(34) reductase QueG [Planctomycetota bacterium]
MNAAEQSVAAKRLAAEHGFPLSGIALVAEDGLSPGSDAYAKWLGAGHHGPLDYMHYTREKRVNLRARFEWARSVLAVAAFYDAEERGTPGIDLEPHVARYARGRDYHRVFAKRLKLLEEALRNAGVCSRTWHYTDTGPLLERAWAEAAGLGWVGKNACLIHPRLGSFMLLAEIVMDSTPAPDKPEPFHCGTCTRCLDACPTHAFTAPGVLDARKCLVTWNIEEQGRTPPEYWEKQGAWAAGCDICQTVCPFNAPSRVASPDLELAQKLPWQEMSLADAITLTPDRFDQAFTASALRRTTLKGLRLGAITAAGNVKSQTCVAALRECLRDPDEDIRVRAQWALEQFGTTRPCPSGTAPGSSSSTS